MRPDYYGSAGFGIEPRVFYNRGQPYPGEQAVQEAEITQIGDHDADPPLRDMNAIRGYHMHVTDGAIGHVENFLLDDADWAIRCLIGDTRNWWPGKHVLIAPYALTAINWTDRQVRLNVTRDRMETSPVWDPAEIAEQAYERALHHHYGWPGYSR